MPEIQTNVKISGRVARVIENKTTKDGVVRDRPFGQIVLEQTVVKQEFIMCNLDELPTIEKHVGADVELPVVQTISTDGPYAGRPNYRLAVPKK